MNANSTNGLRKREDISDEYKWNLGLIYQNDQDWEKDYVKIKELAEKIKELNGRLSESANTLLSCLKTQDELSILLGKAFVYARMKKDEDNTNSTYQALADKINSLSIHVNSLTSFITPEILSIPDAKLKSFFDEQQELVLYRQYIEEIIRFKPHILSEELEDLLAKTGELSQAADYIYGMLNNADIKFPVIKDENGKEIELTKGRFTQFMESKDQRVRIEAFEALYGTYQGLINTFAATLNSNVKKNIFYSKVRNFPSALESSLFDDNIPVEVYDQLIITVNNRLDLMHRYVKLRKKMLGLNELHMYDLYTPMIEDMDIKIKYDEAKEYVKKGLEPLGQEYTQLLDNAFDSRWIDVYETNGKTSGAYSWGAFATPPFILLNYQDNVNNMFTLAHELGHSMHSYYSRKHQPYIYSQYKIFVAEVASTLNEALLMRYILDNTKDKKERLYYINYYLEQFRTTLYRQTMFAEYEKIIHQKAESEEALTPDLLSQLYRELNQKYYGPDMVIDSQINYEWARIPHFYMNFYVYKYATGFSAAISLAEQIFTEGDTAVRRYVEFLKSGGSDYPINLLKKAGVDMNKAEPIEKALDVFEKLLQEMENLI